MSWLDLQNPLIWLIAAVVLGVAEILLPSTIAIGFGLGAVATAGFLWLAGPGVLGVPGLLVLWAVVSGLCWIVLRIVFRNKASKDDPYDGDINEY